MSDTQEKIKDKIDDAAHAAKKATDEAAQKMKDVAYETGKAVKNAGEAIKEKGK
jgi:gas vesicle protein